MIDAVALTPVPGAVIRHLSSSATAVADNEGRFSLEVETIGVYVLRVEQLGYEDSQAMLPSTAPIEFTTISIQPKPIELQGLEVSVASQFEQRRTASAREVRVLDHPSFSASTCSC